MSFRNRWWFEFGDMDPEAATELKRKLSISPDYFANVPDDPTAEQLQQIRRELLDLVSVSPRSARPASRRKRGKLRRW